MEKKVPFPVYFFPIAVAIGTAIWVSQGGGRSDEPSDSTASSSSSVMSVAAASNTTGLPLQIPEGFSLEVLADDLPGARVIAQDSFGNYWVSQPAQDAISVIEMGDDGRPRQVYRGFNGIPLRGPHGLAIDPTDGLTLYVAEEHRIIRVRLYSDAPIEEIAKLPGIGRHATRTLGIGPDDRLYVSIGSTCDVCVEADERHGTIMSMNKDGSDQKIVARGLRNAVFFAWHPETKELWATDMGRDQLGNDLPPEEVNIIRDGGHYGWPWCYGDRVRDTSFRGGETFDCSTTIPPHATLPAHIAPLGLTFLAGDGWPAAMRDDLLVAEHGSWNSTTPVGYKIVRVPLAANGTVEGPAVDFISGWREGGTVHGRPVDVVASEDGTLLITDDRRGVVYRLRAQ